MPDTPFHHIAMMVDKDTQDGIEKRLTAAGYTAPRLSCSSTATAARCTWWIPTA